MKKHALFALTMPAVAAAALLAFSSSASAVELLIPNGDFQTDAATFSFSQSITNWNVSFSGAIPIVFAGPPAEYSGLFTSYGKFNDVPGFNKFVLLDNLGAGTVTLQSGTGPTPTFLVNQQFLGFRYGYLSNDGPNAATHDEFRLTVNFFTNAAGTIALNGGANDIIGRLIADRGTYNDTNAAASPFGGANNPSTATFNNIKGTTTGNLINMSIDMGATFGSFARVSFIVNNLGPVSNTNGNGLGVSGIVLDNVVLNPEPSTFALFAAGIAGLGGLAMRRRRAAAKKLV